MVSKLIIGFTAMISCTVIGNLLFKIGATESNSQASLFGLFSINSLIGLFFFACSVLIYAWLLKLVPLNVAQAFASAQFVAVILASSMFLSEEIPFIRWLGIAFIALGIVLVGFTTKVSASEIAQRNLNQEINPSTYSKASES